MQESVRPRQYPAVLFLNTSVCKIDESPLWAHVLDYTNCKKAPWLLRKIENALKIDLSMALEAKRISESFDVIFAGSERVAIPLSLIGIRKPIVTVVFDVVSPLKRLLIRSMDLTSRWASIGYYAEEDRSALISVFKVHQNKTFRCSAAPTSRFRPDPDSPSDSLLSMGVAKRDYKSLLLALSKLAYVPTRILASSRYGDRIESRFGIDIPDCVQVLEYVPYDRLPEEYHKARFVVLPLEDTTQYSAGYTTALEAFCCGKAIVATATKGMRDLIIHGKTGLLVPPGDPGALGRAIKTLWEDSEMCEAMGREGRRHVEKHYSESQATRNISYALLRAHYEAVSP